MIIGTFTTPLDIWVFSLKNELYGSFQTVYQIFKDPEYLCRSFELNVNFLDFFFVGYKTLGEDIDMKKTKIKKRNKIKSKVKKKKKQEAHTHIQIKTWNRIEINNKTINK